MLGVAKNEILQWNSSAVRIIWFPIFIRATAECMYFVGIDTLRWPEDLMFTIGMYLLACVVMIVAILHAKRELPTSFLLLSDNEAGVSPLPETL